MKVKIQQFLGQNHSWAIVGQNIARACIKKNYEVDLISTDGDKFLPEDLRPYLKKEAQSNYDMQFSYTSLKNFQPYLSNGNRNRFGIWTYEFSGKNSLPTGFAKNYKFCDQIFPPSHFAKQVFMDSGIPESYMTVVPHGVSLQEINSASPYQLKNKKSFKILVNVAQLHKRKNIGGLLEMYGKAFSRKDDICLVIKVQDKKPEQIFELDFNEVIKKFKSSYPNHAEIEIIKEFIPNIYSLYKSCDAALSASHTEAFGMTALEAQATGLINIAPNYGGFVDFLNKDNSLLIEGKEFFVKPDMVYWSYQTGSKAFMPNIDSGVASLREAYNNASSLKKRAQDLAPACQESYSWEKVCNQIISEAKS